MANPNTETLSILWFNWRDIKNPEAGGAEVFTWEVAKRWVKRGHEVTLFTSEFPNCKREEVLDGIRVIRAGGKFSVYWKAKEYYKKYFSKEGYEVVIDEINTRPFLTPKFVSNGEKIVTLIHQLAREYWFYETPFPISYIGYYLLEERWLGNYVKIPTVTVSESTRQDLTDLGFKKVFVVPEGLNFRPLNRVPKKADFPTVAYVGRLKKAKGPDHAVKAFKLIKEKLVDAELWIIGDGYLRKDLEKMSFDGVRMFGKMPEEEKLELLKRAHVLLVPSVREGWGLVVLEANAVGTPAIAYNVHGLRDSIKNMETGILVPYGNVKALAEAAIRVLMNENLCRELAGNALKWSTRFSWDRTAEEFMDIIKSSLS